MEDIRGPHFDELADYNRRKFFGEEFDSETQDRMATLQAEYDAWLEGE
jgi:hypothetical protein